jgi:SAM-dependent methyltransferase
VTDGVRSVVVDAYNRAASGFAHNAEASVYRVLAQPLAVAIAARVEPGATVLDVAAGTGAFAAALFDVAGSDVVAVDAAAGPLRYNPARRRVVADFEALPFADRSFAAAASSFGINHVSDPRDGLVEMARVAPVVGVVTWFRPEPAFVPKQIVGAIIERHAGQYRSAAGAMVDRFSDEVGTIDSMRGAFAAAGMDAEVEAVELVLPWPGAEAYVDYRLTMPTVAGDVGDAARAEAVAAVSALPPDQLTWRAKVVLAVATSR